MDGRSSIVIVAEDKVEKSEAKPRALEKLKSFMVGVVEVDGFWAGWVVAVFAQGGQW
jgi:hypothetical protein